MKSTKEFCVTGFWSRGHFFAFVYNEDSFTRLVKTCTYFTLNRELPFTIEHLGRIMKEYNDHFGTKRCTSE